MFGNDRNWLIAGLVGALVVPGLVFLADMPVSLAAALGLVAFAGTVLLLAPRRVFEGIDVSNVARGRLDLARKVLNEAQPRIEDLEKAAGQIRKATVKAQVGRLASTARAIVTGVEQDANRLTTVQRFLTYYLPSAAEIADRYTVLEQQRQPEVQRVTQTESVIARLEDAFSHYADSLLDSDLAGLDVELRLIESSIAEDMASRQRGGKA